MGYGKRIDTLCSLLTPCKSFADVGCDHGYCSEYMLKNGLCEKAVLEGNTTEQLVQAAESWITENFQKYDTFYILGV